MDLFIERAGSARWGSVRMRCALGRSGFSAAKSDGDGATPLGAFAMRRLLYRADREARPRTVLACQAIRLDDGWCDAPADDNYNRLVRLPYRASAEALWRDDSCYDLVVTLGYNDEPVLAGRGSAIFLHLARADFSPTEGCVALARADLLAVIGTAGRNSRVVVL